MAVHRKHLSCFSSLRAAAFKQAPNRASLHPPALRRSETVPGTLCTSSVWFSTWHCPGARALQFFRCSVVEWGCLKEQDSSHAAPSPRPGTSRPSPVTTQSLVKRNESEQRKCFCKWLPGKFLDGAGDSTHVTENWEKGFIFLSWVLPQRFRGKALVEMFVPKVSGTWS